MTIPDNFITKISNAFYDKELYLYGSQVESDNEGWTRKDLISLTPTGSFFGNINFSNLDKVQEAYGITEQIEAVVTTNYNAVLEQIIGYQGRYYKVFRAIPFDSHKLLILRKWESKSSTLISV